jgi:hypothetical protein
VISLVCPIMHFPSLDGVDIIPSDIKQYVRSLPRDLLLSACLALALI